MIKLFEQYNEYSQVKEWLDKMGVKKYTINDDLTVDVNDSVHINRKNLTEIPIQFGRIKGLFDCSYNKLTTLKGCPKYIDGSLFCSNNKLLSLEYCPEYIGVDLDFKNNNITTLKYHPGYIGWETHIDYNKLSDSLEEFIHINGIMTLFKHQEDYGIWNNDGSFNSGRFDLLKKEFEKGILD